MKEVLRSMENRQNEGDSRNGPFKESHKSSDNVIEDPKFKRIEEINRLILIKSNLEKIEKADDFRRSRKDDTPYVEILKKILNMDSTKKFLKISFLGDGSYSSVNKVKNTENNKIYAMKKFRVKDPNSQISITTLREIKALLSSSHPNIIQMVEVCYGHKWENELAMIMECGKIDLYSLMKSRKQPFETKYIKSFLYQSLSAVHYLHQKHFMHRDIKLSNFILFETGELKLVDFGLARGYESDDERYTSTVATLWYRAPELLFGATNYTNAVDMWAIGCMFAELLRTKEIFPGRSDFDQIQQIFNILGTPNEETWPEFKQLPVCQSFQVNYGARQPLDMQKEVFGNKIGNSELDFLKKCFIYDPAKRITAAGALQHKFFSELPLMEIFIIDDS